MFPSSVSNIDAKSNARPDLKLCGNSDRVGLSSGIWKGFWFLITSGEKLVLKETRGTKDICAINTTGKNNPN